MEENNPKPKNRKWIMLSLAFLISFSLHLLLFGTAPMVDNIMNEMGLSHAEFGLIFSIATVGLAIIRIPWGVMVDKIGYQKVLSISLPIISISAILRGFSTGYYSLLLTQFIMGIGLASVLPCMPPLISEWFSEKSGFGTGVYISGFALGNGTALGLTPYLIEIMVWREVLIVYGLVAMVITVLWLTLSKSSYERETSYKLEEFGWILRNKYVWILTFFLIACMGSYDTLATWMPKVLELKTFDKYPAILLALGFLFSGPTTGSLLDRIRDRKNLIAIIGIGGTLSILGIVYGSFYILLPSLFLAGFFLNGILTVALEAPTCHPKLAPSSGKVVGIISSLGNIGPFLLPVSFGYLIDFTHTYEYSLFLVAAVTVFTTLGGSILWKKQA